MRQVLGKPQIFWTSDGQREAVIATLRRQADVIAVLATGAGKSMLAILPVTLVGDRHELGSRREPTNEFLVEGIRV